MLIVSEIAPGRTAPRRWAWASACTCALAALALAGARLGHDPADRLDIGLVLVGVGASFATFVVVFRTGGVDPPNVEMLRRALPVAAAAVLLAGLVLLQRSDGPDRAIVAWRVVLAPLLAAGLLLNLAVLYRTRLEHPRVEARAASASP